MLKNKKLLIIIGAIIIVLILGFFVYRYFNLKKQNENNPTRLTNEQKMQILRELNSGDSSVSDIKKKKILNNLNSTEKNKLTDEQKSSFLNMLNNK